MKTSRMLVAASCAVVLLNGASAAFAQRGGGGHRGGGGVDGAAMGMSRGGATSGMRQGGFRGRSPGPTIRTHGFGGVHRAPFRHGGIVRGGNFVSRGAFVHGHGFGRPVHFYRPYYTFHPNVRIGFGLFAGYPFAYPYAFHNPYYYPYSSYYSYTRYPAYGSVSSRAYASRSGAVLDETNMGGLSFEITPDDAELFVDNVRVGTVGEFTSTTQPLGLTAGHHHIEIRAAGYQTISFDVETIAGQVLPYQGSLER